MAELAAHLTGTVAEDRPSIFEVLAQENLMSSLRPAIKHASRILAENNPSRYGLLYAYSDEVYALLDLLVQQHYLRKYDASFAENFYGLKRVPSIAPSQGTPGLLPKHLRWKSLIFLVFIPYLKHKLDQLFERLRQNAADGMYQQKSLKNRLIKAFLAAYPIMHLALEGASFWFQMLYVFGKTSVHSLWLKLSGCLLQNLSMEDMQAQSGSPVLDTRTDMSLRERCWSYLGHSVDLLAVSLSSGLSVGMFFLQFVEWWYSSEENTAAINAMPIPSPPMPEKREGVPQLPTVCPLCNRFRTNDTALSVSGYVFCYPCIFNYIRNHHRCPITGYPAEQDHLVKLYLPEAGS